MDWNQELCWSIPDIVIVYKVQQQANKCKIMSLRVLVISPTFYGVEKKITSALEEIGYEVSWIENKSMPFDYHSTNSKFKILRKIYFFFFSPNKRYIDKELSRFENLKFDFLFSINGFIICKYLFRKLKNQNRKLYSILYLWDSIAMYNWAKELTYFDKVYTFDQADADKFGLLYKPNFYLKNNESIIKEVRFDLFFVGKFTPFRLSILDKISVESTKYGFRSFIKLWPAFKIFPHNYIIYQVLKLLDLKFTWVKSFLLNYEAFEGYLKKDCIMTESLDFEDIQNLACLSNVIIDIPFQDQTGYTHRLIEALANGKKVITTNSNIKTENFYKSDQIKVIDFINPEFDYKWTKEEMHFPVPGFLNGLELNSWLTSIVHAEVA